MKTVRTIAAALLATNCVAANALGAQCISGDDMSALRTAAMQQNLMVAALTCHDIGRYNRFVRAHQPELIDSDARLKQFFIRRGGEAGYHAFKTELANAASLRSIHQSDSFCLDAREQFDFASRPISLAVIAGEQPVAIGVSYRVCADPRGDGPRMADAAHARRHAYKPAADGDDTNANDAQDNPPRHHFDDGDDEDSDNR